MRIEGNRLFTNFLIVCIKMCVIPNAYIYVPTSFHDLMDFSDFPFLRISFSHSLTSSSQDSWSASLAFIFINFPNANFGVESNSSQNILFDYYFYDLVSFF